MEQLKLFFEYMTLKEMRELKSIIDRYIEAKEHQLKLVKESLR